MRLQPGVHAQEAVFSAFTSNAGLADQIKALAGKEGWEQETVQVSLPAGVVQQLLALQAKEAGNTLPVEAGNSLLSSPQGMREGQYE